MILNRLVNDIDDKLPSAPFVRANGSLLMMVGLPGTGKSFVVESLARELDFVVISTDNVRLHMRSQPTYTAAELVLVYEVCYALIELRLRRGQRVVFDATNYLAARRQQVMAIAKRTHSPVAVCYVQAAQEAIRQRMRQRASSDRRKTDLSDADWPVYQWMVETQEPVMVDHIVIDTTDTTAAELGEKLAAYWLDVEASASSNFDIQPPGRSG